jgi:hypothetical protein
MATIFGRFYFKRTTNKNLVGEFSNNKSGNAISTESADLIEGTNDNYFGKYNSTWQENGKPLFAILTISPKNSNPKLFLLDWSRNGKSIFLGEGMLCDDILIGNYWDV